MDQYLGLGAVCYGVLPPWTEEELRNVVARGSTGVTSTTKPMSWRIWVYFVKYNTCTFYRDNELKNTYAEDATA